MVQEDVLERFYKRIAERGTVSLDGVPESIVFFVRRGIEARTGALYSLEHVSIALFLEGYLDPDKYYKTGLPVWYINRYCNGSTTRAENWAKAARSKFVERVCRLQDKEYTGWQALYWLRSKLPDQEEGPQEFIEPW